MIHFEADFVERFSKWAQGFAFFCHLIFLSQLYGGCGVVHHRHLGRRRQHTYEDTENVSLSELPVLKMFQLRIKCITVPKQKYK
jgi:hypothetical protein